MTSKAGLTTNWRLPWLVLAIYLRICAAGWSARDCERDRRHSKRRGRAHSNRVKLLDDGATGDAVACVS
jgi:hypothetical protein